MVGKPTYEELEKKVVELENKLTDRAAVEEALWESEKKYKNLVDNIGIGVSLISRDMKILALNNQMKQWFPWMDETNRPICYRALNDSPRDEVCSFCPTLKTLKDGQRHEAVSEIQSSGGIRLYRIISTPNKYKYGSVNSAIGMVEDITERRLGEEELKKREYELEARSHDLEEVNSALRALLKHMREYKNELEGNVLSNVKQLVVPYLERLKISQMDRGQLRLAGIMEENLNNITSPFVGRLSSNFISFSPMEVRVAELVKDGKANKEIAELLCISINTILSHRKNLRTKLGLKKKRINLRAYLLSLEE